METKEITRTEFDEVRRRVDSCEARLGQGDVNFALLNQRLDQMSSDISDIKASLKAIQDKPARRWDAVINQIISWAVVALLAYIAFGG